MWTALSRLLLIAIAAAQLGSRVCAHEAESSYLRLRLEHGRLGVRVTFDVFTLQKIAPDLDGNADGALSKAELEAATPAIRQFIEANFSLELDGLPRELGIASPPFWPLDAPDPLPSAAWHDQTALVMFPFDLELAEVPAKIKVFIDAFATLGPGHRLFTVFEQNGHSQPVILSATRREQLFETGTSGKSRAPVTGKQLDATEEPEQPSSATQFLREGVKHILTGYDHICFLLALLLAAKRIRSVVAIVTAFTIAHSITLILAARGVIALPSRWVESAIAATILYVALENIATRGEPARRWLLTFTFGLVHGLGFASVLAGLQLPADAMVSSLLLFNVGVEAGQLMIVVAVWPVFAWLGRSVGGRRAKWALNAVIALFGLLWLVDRVFALRWMPF